jgi:transcriptional regulator with XRE-family HTH domain
MSREIIRATRQRLRLSQSELARRSNVSRWKLNNFELGDNGKLDPAELNRISDVLRKEARELSSAAVQ